MRTVVITGITGKSGQYFLKQLVKEREQLKDYSFILLCRKSEKPFQNSEGYLLVKKVLEKEEYNIGLLEADLENPEEVRKAFVNPVYMLIHIASVKLSMDIVPVAMECGVDNYVLVHTTGIYSKYKAAGEEYRQIEKKIEKLKQYYQRNGREIALTILRPTMIYGDLSDKNVSIFIKMVDKLRIFPTVNGAHYDLQPVWCGDLGKAYFDVMMNWEVTKNKEYILSGGAPISLRKMFEVMAKQLHVKNIFVSCPFPIAYVGAWGIYLISIKKIDMREKVQRLVEPRAFSHEEATKDFGYNPVTFDVGVRKEIQMYRKEKCKISQ